MVTRCLACGVVAKMDREAVGAAGKRRVLLKAEVGRLS